MPPSRATAQIAIQLNPETGNFQAEMGAPNGSRRKIDLPPDPIFWGDVIQQELIQLNLWLRAVEQDEKRVALKAPLAKARFDWTLEKHRRIWDETARKHNKGGESGPDFANRTLGSRKSPHIRTMDIGKILDRE